GRDRGDVNARLHPRTAVSRSWDCLGKRSRSPAIDLVQRNRPAHNPPASACGALPDATGQPLEDTMRRILKLINPVALALALTAGAAQGMSGGDAAAPADPAYGAAHQLVEEGKYAEAIPLLE